jgi:arsenate reductase-like glutaredoxin family protein
MTLYGLLTCPQCTLARKAFDRAGVPLTFRDIRTDPLSPAEWAPLLTEFGDRLVDRSSQQYRNLTAFLRESEADAQLLAQPALMARPVITDGTRWTLGWDEAIRAGWGV